MVANETSKENYWSCCSQDDQWVTMQCAEWLTSNHQQ